jgi:alpha-galactosidase
MRLPGLDPGRRYRVEVLEPAGPPMTNRPAGRPPRLLTGRALAEVGLRPPVLVPEDAWLIEVTAE